MSEDNKDEVKKPETAADKYASFISNQKQNDLFKGGSPSNVRDIGISTGKISKENNDE